MSVASKNPFALLDDEPAAPAAVAVSAKKEANNADAPKRSIPGLNATRNGVRGAAEGKSRPAGGAGEAGADGEAPQRRGDARNARGSRAEGRGARGGRGGRGAGGRGGRGRQFDRHSATGKVDSEKKLEQGWGGENPKRELDAEDGGKADAAAEGGDAGDKKDDGASPAANGTSDEKKVTIVEEEEEKDNTKTLDEYLAEQAAKRAQIGGAREIRKADADATNLGTQVTKQLGDDYYSSTKERSVRQRERKEKQVLEIEQSFNPPPAPASRGTARGGRGGSSRGRGAGGDRGRGSFGGERGRGRGASRGGRGGSAGANINLSDSNAFPTLG